MWLRKSGNPEEGLGVKIVKMCTLCHRACTESVYVTEHTFLLGTAKKCMNTCIHRYYWMVYTLHVKNVQQNYKNVRTHLRKQVLLEKITYQNTGWYHEFVKLGVYVSKYYIIKTCGLAI